MYEKYRALKESGLIVFDRRSIANILNLAYASTNPVLDRLVRKGVLLRLKRDRYILPERLMDSSRKIANELVKPSYISLWTALSDAGLTTQVPREVQSVTTKRSAVIESEDTPSFRYVRIPETLFFGYEPDAERVFRAHPEKALLDLLYTQRGRVDWESMALQKFSRQRLSAYIQRFPAWIHNTIPSSLSRR